MASSSERAVNFAIRVRGVDEAAADFKRVGQAGEQSISQIQKAAQAQAGYETALTNANTAGTAFAAAQAAANQELASAKAALKAGSASEADYQAAVVKSKNSLELLRAEYRAAKGDLSAAASAVVASRVAANDLAPALDHATKSTGNARLAQLEWQHVMRASTGAILSGMSPIQALTLESGRIVEAMQLSSGGASKFASFMGGPWGIALGLGAGAALQFGLSMLKSKDAVGAAVDELQKHAEKSHIDELAQQRFAHTIEGETEALKQNRKALDELNQVQETAAEKALRLAAATAVDTLNTQKDTLAKLENAKAAKQALLDNRSGGMLGAGQASAGFLVIQQQIDRLEAARKTAAENVEKAQAALTEAGTKLVVERASAGTEDEIKKRFAQQVDAAQAATAALQNHAKATLKTETEKRHYIEQTNTALAEQVKRIDAARDAEIKRYQDSQRVNRDTADRTAFAFPVSGGRVTGNFGEQRPGHTHAGLDIAVPVGTAVHAPAGGVIIEAGSVPGYGNVVFIDHGRGTITRLAHLSSIGVSKGQRVDQGDTIGLSGGARGAAGAGDSTGPHVHYEVRVNGRAVDPRKGPFNTDAMAAAEKAQKDAVAAEQKETIERQDYQNRLATLLSSELDARRALVTNPAVLAQLQRDEIEVQRKKYDDNLDSMVKEGKLQGDHAKELKGLNDETAKLKLQLIERQEQERQLAEQNAADQRALGLKTAEITNEEELLHGQQDLARTQHERRAIERRLIDLQYQQEKLQNDLVISQAERVRADRNATEEAKKDALNREVEAQLRNESLNARKSQALERSDRQTADPLTSYLNSIPRNAAEINEKVQGYVADELESVRKGIDDAITKAIGVKDPLLAGIIDLFVEEVLIRPIGDALQKHSGGSSGGLGGFLSGLLHLAGSVAGAAAGGGGGLSPEALSTLDVGSIGSAMSSADIASATSWASLPFASGTPGVPVGQWFEVGENGRELMRYSGGNRLQVASNQQSRRFLSEGMSGPVVNQTIMIPAGANPRLSASTVARGTQVGLARATKSGLARPAFRPGQ
jgi:murein DD-endopeptidase MepM/ murein hydrolase activator NlpD